MTGSRSGETFIKEGDFNVLKEFSPSQLETRGVKYSSHNSENKIFMVAIILSPDEGLQINFYVRNLDVIDALKLNGFLPPYKKADICQYLFTSKCRIPIPNLEYAISLLKTVAIIEKSIHDIENEIIDTIRPYIKNEQALNGWIKTGDFSYRMPPGFGYRHAVVYENLARDANIFYLSLMGELESRYIQLKINLKKAREFRELFKGKYRYAGYHCDYTNSIDGLYILYINSREDLSRHLQKLTSFDNTIHLIRDHIEQSYNCTYRNSNNTSSSHRLFNLSGSNSGDPSHLSQCAPSEWVIDNKSLSPSSQHAGKSKPEVPRL